MDYITVKLVLVVVGLVGFGAWQLYDINRELEKDDQPESSSASESDT